MAMRFPVVKGENLLRHKVMLPADFEGEYNAVLLAFQRWQQRLVDTWIPFLEQLEGENDRFHYYELPTIQRLNFVARTFINEGMRAGIPDPVTRARTITLYLDKTALRRALDLPGEDDIYVLLVDRQGGVLWRTEGAFDPEKGKLLRQVLRGGGTDEAQ
jgi:hypothetical protein